jgi:hypothetical protein
MSLRRLTLLLINASASGGAVSGVGCFFFFFFIILACNLSRLWRRTPRSGVACLGEELQERLQFLPRPPSDLRQKRVPGVLSFTPSFGISLVKRDGFFLFNPTRI